MTNWTLVSNYIRVYYFEYILLSILLLFLSIAPLTFTQNYQRIQAAHPGFGLYEVRNYLLSSRSNHQSWETMFQAYSTELWIVLGAALLFMILLLALSTKKDDIWQTLLLAKIAAVKAVFAQSFDETAFLNV